MGPENRSRESCRVRVSLQGNGGRLRPLPDLLSLTLSAVSQGWSIRFPALMERRAGRPWDFSPPVAVRSLFTLAMPNVPELIFG